VLLLNVEDVIENYVFKIADLDCDNVLIIDAVRSTPPRIHRVAG